MIDDLGRLLLLCKSSLTFVSFKCVRHFKFMIKKRKLLQQRFLFDSFELMRGKV